VTYGKAAVGSSGIFSSGSTLGWGNIYDHSMTDSIFGSVQWHYRWRASNADAGKRSGRLIIPSKHRQSVQELISASVKKTENEH
jgi:hypothetical protein